MTIKNKQGVFNWTLASLMIGVIMSIIGFMFTDMRAITEDIKDLTVKVNTIENKPFISSKDDIDLIKIEISNMKVNQANTNGKLELLINLAKQNNLKIDRHISDSIPRPVTK